MRAYLIVLIILVSGQVSAQSYFLDKCRETINNEELANDDLYKIQFSWFKIRFNTSNCSLIATKIQQLNSINQLAPAYQYDLGDSEENTPFKPFQLKRTPLHQLVTEIEWDKYKAAFKYFHLLKEFKNLLHFSYVPESFEKDESICQSLDDLPSIKSISIRHSITDPIQWRLSSTDIECLISRKIEIYITGPFTPDGTSEKFINQISGIENYLGEIQHLYRYRNLNYLGLIDYKGKSRLKELTGIKGLRRLHINLNNIENPEDVRLLTHLKYLSMNCSSANKNCTGQALENINFIADLKSLRGLDLSGNKIQSLEPIARLKKLEFLNLRMNRLKSIQGIQELTALKFLDISSNLIKSIHLLQEISSLKLLNVSDNEITDFGVFKYLSKLKYLSAGRNSYLIERFTVPKTLKVLNLNGNHSRILSFSLNVKHAITPIFENLEEQNWTKLTIFDQTQNENNILTTQSNNLVQKLDTSHLENLEYLSLSHNLLHSYQFLKSLKSLKYLDLSSSKIQDRNFLKYVTSNIEFLQVRDNSIKDFSDLKSFTRLKFLDISNNDLKDSLLEIRSMTLTDLIVDRCNLFKSPKLDLSPNIERLSLGNNLLRDFSYPSLRKLKQVLLWYNNFEKIPDFNGNTSLHSIALRSNKIQSLTGLKNPNRAYKNSSDQIYPARIRLDIGENLIKDLSSIKDDDFELILDSNPVEKDSPILCPQESSNKSIAVFCSSP